MMARQHVSRLFTYLLVCFSRAPADSCSLGWHVERCRRSRWLFSRGVAITVIWIPRLALTLRGGSIAEWFACWTQAQKGRVQVAVATLSGNSLKQTVHTHCASVHQAAKLVAALLRVARVTVGLVESNGNLPSGL